MPRPLGRTELAERFGLNLSNALAGDIELLADLFKRVLALAADAEPQPDHFLFLGRERLQDVRGFIPDIGIDDGVDRRTHPAVFDEIAQRGFSIAAHVEVVSRCSLLQPTQ